MPDRRWVLDQRWTSDRELDRLAPLAMSLHHWSQVYDRWRLHELAAARPQQARFDRADLSMIDDLRGVQFEALTATSQRLSTVGAALSRLAETTGMARSGLAEAWRDGASQGAVRCVDQLQRGAQDCAALCERLGLHLEIAMIDTVAPVIKSAVDEILARSGRWEHAAGRRSRESGEQRIAAIEADAAPAGWRGELDELVVDYDAVLGLLRANLAAAKATITGVYQALHHELVSLEVETFGDGPFDEEPIVERDPVGAPGEVMTRDLPVEANQQAGLAPVSTMLASAGSGDDSVGDDDPSAGSSSASGGGGSSGVAAGPGPPGSALLGELSESPTTDPGAATLASVSGDDPAHHPGAGSAGATGGAAGAPMAGALGSAGAEGQQRTGRPWSAPAVGEDTEREASWQRLRALLGEDAAERPGRGP